MGNRSAALAFTALLLGLGIASGTSESTYASPVVLPPGLWVMNSDGTGQERLIRQTDFGQAEPDWSPDGEWLVVGKGSQVYIVAVDGSEKFPLTDQTTLSSDPHWSPDGEHIAFSRLEGRNQDIYVMDSDGGEMTRLTSSPKRDVRPEWSPDGKSIAFVRLGNRGGLFVKGVDGKDKQRLVGGVYGEPVWSPDGAQIAFVGGHDIWVISASGTEMINLTRSDEPWEDSPAWSPDSSQITYVNSRGSIFVIDRDGTHKTRLLFATKNRGAWDASWSPDGSTILFHDLDEVYVMSSDGSHVRNLTDTRGPNFHPSWSPNGSRIAFLHRRF